MRLTAQAEGEDLLQTVAAVLDRRLQATSDAPIAVALSGGGDSVALLHAADAWARAHGRGLLVLNVDHRLQSASACWARACAARAQALGWPFRALAWDGDKPARGLPAAARAARHALLAEAARDAGAQILLMGHTAGDVAEARTMRAAGSTTPDPREWAPSPAWPQGRGVFILRPLLGLSRAAIRAWLAGRGLDWIEDPANADPTFARPRARAALAGAPAAAVQPSTSSPMLAAAALARACRGEAWGGLALSRAALREAGPDAARAFVSAACLCAAGSTRPPRGARLDRLLAALRGEAPLIATLAGARVEADDADIRFLREPGEAGRGGLEPLVLSAGATQVWDGRFEITAAGSGATVRPTAGLAARLPADHRAALAALPASARGATPAADVGPGGPVWLLAPGAFDCRSLVLPRLQATCGAVARELPNNTTDAVINR